MTNFLYQNDLPSDLNLGDSIAIDTETTGLSLKRDRLCVIQISNGNGDAHLVRFDKGNYNAPNLKKLLSDEKVLKIFHFARFDLAVLKSHLGLEIKNIYCTKIASKLIRTYTDAHGLKAICKELINVELSKDQQSSDWGNENISEDQIKYAASDVLYLHRLKEKLDEMLKREGRMEIANQCFGFLQTRSSLDLIGFESDIFSH
jgi:ribonuclease D